MALSKDLHFQGIKSCYLQCKAQVLITNVVFCLSSVITVLHLTQQHITLVKRLRYILDCHLHSHWIALPTEILTLNSPTEKICNTFLPKKRILCCLLHNRRFAI